MRLLHTADWHLGASLSSVSLIEDQQRFLGWLLETIRRERIDALLISGDIFDLRHPSAEAQALYYQFLARLAALDPTPAAVITAGNHDSPSRLEAPADLLNALNIRVVGWIGEQESRTERLLVPLPDSGDPKVVVAAVPYVHEHWLGVRSMGLTGGELRIRMREAFTGLYTELNRGAAERWPHATRIAMGHLTVSSGPVDRDDYPNEIHQVGTISALPPATFGDGWEYVALGHLHRPMEAGSPRYRYSGTPVAISFREGSVPRELRLLEVGGEGRLRHERLPVPRWRDLRSFEGTEEEVLNQLHAATFDGHLEPLIRLEVQVPQWDPTLDLRLHDAVREMGGSGPRLIGVLQRSRAERATFEDDEEGPTLEEMDPPEVFRHLVVCERGEEPDEELMVAFRELAAEPEPETGEGDER